MNKYLNLLILSLCLTMFSFHVMDTEDELEMVELKLDEYLSIRQQKEYYPNVDNYGLLRKCEITAVFVYYDISVKYGIDRKILIPKRIAADREYVMNLLIKAVDKSWGKRHLYLSPDSTRYGY